MKTLIVIACVVLIAICLWVSAQPWWPCHE